MATEVFLMMDVANLGKEGDVVKVSDGYARNYLLPRKVAAPVTEATRRRLAKLRVERDAKAKVTLEAARQKAAVLKKASCTITVKTGEGEKMYGSVTPAAIVAVLKEQGIELDKDALKMEGPIKELGVFEVPVKLHPDVEASVKVWVVEE